MSQLKIVILMGLAMGWLGSTAQALTVVWDFDSTLTQTSNLEPGAIDGDSTAPEWWRPDPEHPGRRPRFHIVDGYLNQTYEDLEKGFTPNDGTGPFHSTGLFVGDDYNTFGTSLGMQDFQTSGGAPIIMIGGEIGWSTNRGVGGEIYLLLRNEAWFVNSFTIRDDAAEPQLIPTNTIKRHVIDVGKLFPSGSGGAWDGGTIDGMLFDVFAIWTPPTSRPLFAHQMWINEFDNDPNVTYLRWDWVAFTDNPDFRSDYTGPVEPTRAEGWAIYE